jgi:VWFA-related protein
MPSASTCRERRRGRVAALTLLAALLAGARHGDPEAAQAGRGRAETFRSATELVVLQVSVVDRHGRAVPGLQAEDFAVYEEGARQQLALFETASAPLDVMLLLDTSGSMGVRMGAAHDAAIELVRTMRAGDRVSLVLFNDHVRIAQPLTEDLALVEAAIRRSTAMGGTALHEAIYIALRELGRGRTGDALRRQALVVLSDGADTSSRSVALDDVLDTARRSAVTVFTIMPAGPPVPIGLNVTARQGDAEFNLRTLARETGGQAFLPGKTDDLSTTYRQIAEELSQQYVLAYVPVSAGDGFRRVAVQIVERPDARARTRTGYYAARRRPLAGAAPGRDTQ